ncbi:MAG TPA: hypothetical protein VNR40_00475 [Steroidobacter sp.]|nr:hypothetical protein [Steroidobacter sp.]
MNSIRHFTWAALAALTALFATNSHAATIVLQSQSDNISVGDEFRVDVILRDAFAGQFTGDTLLAFGFNLSFNNSALSLLSSSVGAGWDDDSPFLDVDVAGSVFPGLSDDGTGADILLGHLSFSALNAGNFTLALNGNPLDNPNLGLIFLGGEAPILAQALVNVTPVPLPAMGWLFGSLLFGLFRVRRCR